MRSNRMIEYNGATRTLQQWAEQVGIGKHALFNRLRTGWTIERALTTPTLPRGSWSRKR